MNLQDLIFNPIQVPCFNCFNLISVTIEGLDDKEEITCPKCNCIFISSLDVNKFLKLVKEIENGCSDPTRFE